MWIREEYLEKNHIQLLFEEVFYKATRIYRGLRGIWELFCPKQELIVNVIMYWWEEVSRDDWNNEETEEIN
jgi:hypothetical protein